MSTDSSTTELVAELQLFAKTNAPHSRAVLDLPLLSALSANDPAAGSVGELIDAAVAEAAERPEAAPLQSIFPPSGELWQTNLSGRQRQVAQQMGMSHDSFRRRREDRPSPYDLLCETLAKQLLGHDPAPSATDSASLPPATLEPIVADAAQPTAPPSTDDVSVISASGGRSRRRLVVGAALSTAAIVGGVLVWSNRSESQPTQASPLARVASETSTDTTDLTDTSDLTDPDLTDTTDPPAPTPTSTAAPSTTEARVTTEPAGGRADETGNEVEEVSDADVEAAANTPTDVDLGVTCDPEPDPDPVAEAKREAIRQALLRRGERDCVDLEVDFSGELFRYTLYEGPNVTGGAVGRTNDDGSFDITLLPTGAWMSFAGLGFPTGEIVPSHGGYEIVTEGGTGKYIGESEFGRYYYLEFFAYDKWVEEGAENGPLGMPTSDPYMSGGQYRQDFEGGYGILASGNSVEVNYYTDDRELLPAIDEIEGTIVEVGKMPVTQNSYAWYVDDEGRRWLLSENSFKCAGGEANVSLTGLPGDVVHELEFAGVASCSIVATGTFPRQGPAEPELYCAAGDDDAELQIDGDGQPICVSNMLTRPVELENVCAWQYGPDAVLVNDGVPMCYRSEAELPV